MEDFEGFFEDLEDPRTGNAKLHSLHEVLVIALCTVVCGGETCADMALFGRSKEEFLRQFLRLEHGIPSHDTFSRLFRLLDPERFHAWFVGFMKQFAEAGQGVIAIDGKTMRRSFDRASAASPLHLVSAFAADQRLVLGQIAVADKSNEIVAVPKLLELLSLKGRTVTADAMSCQRKIARQVIDQGGNYVLALKGNQETLHDDVRRFLDDPLTPLASAVETDKGHGRIEIRTASLSTDIAWLQESHDWPGLKAVGKIAAGREIDGRTSRETRCYLLSEPLAPEAFNAAVGPETAKTTAPKTSPFCASSPSTSPNSNPQKAPCAESSSEPDGITPSSPKSSLSSLNSKCDSPASAAISPCAYWINIRN
jgi:predicted transposase YbfD/YdcC